MEAAQATYVYGVLPARDAPPKNSTGIGGAPLREIVSEKLAALVSDLPDSGELNMGRQEITTHARVLEEVIERGTVLPMRFGVVMAGEPAVKEQLLDAHREELEQQLTALSGKVELRLRAIYDEDALLGEIVREDHDVARLREQLKGKSADATYYGRIRLGELVTQAVEHKRAVDAEQILDALTPLALQTQLSEVSHERMALNASFLVERERIPEFDRAVDRIGLANAERLRLQYPGPLPPHSFVELGNAEAS